MTTPKRSKQIAVQVLRHLQGAGHAALPQSLILDYLAAEMRPRVTAPELTAAIELLKKEQAVEPFSGDLGDDEPRWLITEAGQVLLRRNAAS